LVLCERIPPDISYKQNTVFLNKSSWLFHFCNKSCNILSFGLLHAGSLSVIHFFPNFFFCVSLSLPISSKRIFRFPLWIHKNKNQQKKITPIKKKWQPMLLCRYECVNDIFDRFFSLIQSTPNSYFYLVLVSPLVFLHVYFSSWRK